MLFHFYSDPSHGWVQVPLSLIDKLGLTHQISEYSYYRGKYAYLEEDADATLFIDTLKARGIPFTTREHTTDARSMIRNYARYPERFGTDPNDPYSRENRGIGPAGGGQSRE